MAHLKAIGEGPWAASMCRLILHPLLALVSVASLVALIGWTGQVNALQHLCTVGAGLIFGLERIWAYLSPNPNRREKRRLGYHAVVAGAVLAAALVLATQPLTEAGRWWRAGHVFVQISIIASGLASLIHHQPRFTARAFHPGAVLMGSFLVMIACGALLLKMPRCVMPGESLTWLDAFFTSTSAVCVTGLTVQDTATFFSPTGQTVLLILIQIGGIGIMTLTFFAAVVLFEGLSLHDRLLLGKMIQENRLARIGRTLAFIVTMTFVCEGVGALVLYLGANPLHPEGRLFHSVFHAVSAFCNAGFSTLPDGMASGAVWGNHVWQICILTLVVIGGMGALANEDLSMWAGSKIKRRMGRQLQNPRLRIHTRLVLVMTGLLIFGGAALIMITEFALWDGPDNGGKVMTALFHSITARTAGFNTVAMGEIGPLTIQVLMILMLIGGSPGGTAGGLRTTVVAVGLGHLWNQMRTSRRGMVAFNRTIPPETGAKAMGLIVLAGIWLTLNFVALQLVQAGSGVSETVLLFELISAFATVGLSRDLTPDLTEGAKALLIVNMFVGRIGLLTVMATLVKPDRRPSSGKPSEDILLT
jgi:trk system potassium uptake protein